MRRIVGIVVIIQVTAYTILGKSCKGSVLVAFAAINAVALGQREKIMVDIGCVPADAVYGMTLLAILVKPTGNMVGFFCIQIIRFMAIVTLNSQRFITKQGGGFMTKGTISCPVGPQERKPAALMHIRNVFNDPGFGGMTSCTIRAHRLVMHIGMTINTGSFCI